MNLLQRAFAPIETNSYLLLDPLAQEAIWIDPAPTSASRVSQNLPSSYQLLAILCTHSHWDHIAAIGQLERFEKTPVWVHTLDAANLIAAGSDGLPWPSNIPKPEPCQFQTFEEGHTWKVGRYTLEALHTPGHSPGSCCFIEREERWLLSGDTLFAFGYGRVDTSTGNAKAMGESLKRLKTLPMDFKIYPGHGPSSCREDFEWLDEIA